MTRIPLRTRLWLSLLNGLITGGIADLIYLIVVGQTPDEDGIGISIKISAARLAAVILISALNTFAFLELTRRRSSITLPGSSSLGGCIACVGSFFCSWVIGAGSPEALSIVLATPAFLPVSFLIGSVSGRVLTRFLLRPGQEA